MFSKDVRSQGGARWYLSFNNVQGVQAGLDQANLMCEEVHCLHPEKHPYWMLKLVVLLVVLPKRWAEGVRVAHLYVVGKAHDIQGEVVQGLDWGCQHHWATLVLVEGLYRC